MILREYVKERMFFILMNLFVFILSGLFLIGLKVNIYAVVFIFTLNFICSMIFYIYDYFNKKKYYENIMENLDSLDKKYLISDIIEEPVFLDGKILYNIIKQTDKSMNDEVAKLRNNNNEYREYIELWVHEIKTPISSCKLLIENNKSKITESINEEVEKVENYIEQALFYARSNDVEKDCVIKKMKLHDTINTVIRRNSNELIGKKVKIDLDNVEQIIYCDSKWLEFILHQIISNSIKYMDKENKILKLYCENKDNNILLHIWDNGVGIRENDISKVFEKGFTGENGRKFGKSTGIGLYLCKKLCNKLGLNIKLKSKDGEGTTITIKFPINKMMIFE